MKKFVLAVLMLCSALAWAGAEPNPADYTLNVHVGSSRINGRGFVRLKVVIDGKKYELEGQDNESGLLAPGDYKAKAVVVKVKDAHSYDVYGAYELLFPDKKTRRYGVVGILE
jgi:hypothetical protein